MAYLELQINNKSDYDFVKLYSNYSSDRTRVVTLSAQDVNSINKKYPDLLNKYINNEDYDKVNSTIPDPKVKLKDGKLYLENGNIEMLSYLDARSDIDPEIKIVNLKKLFDLINNDIINTTEDFDDIMYPLNEESYVHELFASKGKMRFRKKLWSFQTYDYNMKIKDLEFGKAERKTKNYMTLNLRVKEFMPDSKTVSLIGNNKPTAYVAKFFYITPNMVNLLREGRDITIASEKAYGSGKDGYKLVNPIILPKGHNIEQITNLKSPAIYPTALYNAAYSEYMYRKEKE